MQPITVVSLITVALLSLGAPSSVTSAPRVAVTHHRDPIVPMHARGTFQVQITPLAADDYADAAAMGRMLLDKQFTGDITGTGKGQMITGMGTAKGSAAYSAIERVTGTVHGRTGSFMLQHTGIMHDGAQTLTITVVPASGTGELAGMAGTFTLTITDKVHHYDLAYTLPASH